MAQQPAGAAAATVAERESPVDVPLPQMPETAPRSAQRPTKSAAHSPGRRKTRRSGAEKSGKKAGMPVKAISVSLPAHTAAAWKDRARRDGVTQVDVLLDAVSTQHARLGDLVREHRIRQRSGSAPASDGLFVRKQQSDDGFDPYVAVSLRMLSANVDVLDGLVHSTGATSRSQLVLAALTEWLGQAEESGSGSPDGS